MLRECALLVPLALALLVGGASSPVTPALADSAFERLATSCDLHRTRAQSGKRPALRRCSSRAPA
ncbi:MAG: hypothetical protein U5J83_15555 [Bryobacterales bacterium]|nr:hypothetical protein [Bryobacterales bacterium]